MQYTHENENKRIRNRFNQRIGRINEEKKESFSITYENGESLEINKADVEVLPEVNHNLLIVSEQEDFMHLLYDIVHIGIATLSLQFRFDYLNKSFDLKYLLNTRFKNEKYCDDKEYPIAKVLYQNASYYQLDEKEVFFSRKLTVLKMLVDNGANIKKLNEPYSFHQKLNLEYLKERNIINDDIINYIKNFI